MMIPKEFQFLDPGELQDGSLKVRLLHTYPADTVKQWVPFYRFAMHLDGVDHAVGHIDFRAVATERLINFGGNIGYEVDPDFRGLHLAERGCRVLLPFIRQHNFAELWVTCNPDNFASRKTLERLGAVLIGIVDTPTDSDMYQMGEIQKCRYRLDLEG